jgi:hypothetical protein
VRALLLSTDMGVKPQRVIHADWSVGPAKRWAARAELQPSGRYVAGAPRIVTPAELLTDARRGSTLIGFDFPIGLPAAYAKRAGVSSFSELLPQLGQGAWSSFFHVASERSEISLRRPFYPARPGHTKCEHLVAGLGLDSADELLRRCETASGRRACPMFWTLGGNQVGRAAITGWQEFLQPARAEGIVELWPFDGALDALLARGRTVITETYPAIAYERIGATLPTTDRGRGKRSRSSRAASALGVQEWARNANIDVTPELAVQLQDGFGNDRTGEDRFDAIAGLLGMLAVTRGSCETGMLNHDDVQLLEGWILGRFAKRA